MFVCYAFVGFVCNSSRSTISVSIHLYFRYKGILHTWRSSHSHIALKNSLLNHIRPYIKFMPCNIWTFSLNPENLITAASSLPFYCFILSIIVLLQVSATFLTQIFPLWRLLHLMHRLNSIPLEFHARFGNHFYGWNLNSLVFIVSTLPAGAIGFKTAAAVWNTASGANQETSRWCIAFCILSTVATFFFSQRITLNKNLF